MAASPLASPRTEIARSLRHNQTSAEALLWAQLRDRRFGGHKFVRQSPIGPYVADFVCRRAKLVIEVEGPTHFQEAAEGRDGMRSAFMARQGYRTLRVTNDDVRQRMDQVREAIFQVLNGEWKG